MRYDLEGEVAQPDPRVVWACPTCRRTRVDELGRASGRTCAGDPITGAGHPPAAMTRTPAAGEERPPAEARALEVLGRIAQHDGARWVDSAELEARLADVDPNPFRREWLNAWTQEA